MTTRDFGFLLHPSSAAERQEYISTWELQEMVSPPQRKFCYFLLEIPVCLTTTVGGGGGQNPENRNPDRSKSRQSKSRTSFVNSSMYCPEDET
ncbi:hypothetical protein M514_24025 [Trichuris suis]|uniref:Uncharacterized protein n=1 Tax=Trichuris suis TaxID=68888 RepID=A0A085N2S1_9BILA|nr:hypothetical protein M514_24025 [Trichuris suis]